MTSLYQQTAGLLLKSYNSIIAGEAKELGGADLKSYLEMVDLCEAIADAHRGMIESEDLITVKDVYSIGDQVLVNLDGTPFLATVDGYNDTYVHVSDQDGVGFDCELSELCKIDGEPDEWAFDELGGDRYDGYLTAADAMKGIERLRRKSGGDFRAPFPVFYV